MTKAIFSNISEANFEPTPTLVTTLLPSSSSTSFVEPVYIDASSAVTWNPFVPFKQVITLAFRSATLEMMNSISIVQPSLAISVSNALYSMIAFAPLRRRKASPVQPLDFQSTFSKVVLMSP